ncbi:hypothetical protein PENTCL1PPCAC_13269, partial [Pristionchus entomophagus]
MHSRLSADGSVPWSALRQSAVPAHSSLVSVPSVACPFSSSVRHESAFADHVILHHSSYPMHLLLGLSLHTQCAFRTTITIIVWLSGASQFLLSVTWRGFGGHGGESEPRLISTSFLFLSTANPPRSQSGSSPGIADGSFVEVGELVLHALRIVLHNLLRLGETKRIELALWSDWLVDFGSKDELLRLVEGTRLRLHAIGRLDRLLLLFLFAFFIRFRFIFRLLNLLLHFFLRFLLLLTCFLLFLLRFRWRFEFLILVLSHVPAVP